MPEAAHSVVLKVNGVPITVAAGTTVAAAILITGASTRTSVTGEPRGPLCGMGICFECRATIDGALHQRTCQILCADGMEVRTT
jgi:D-hydroxyproline dehydrogenase subunit gamma